MRPKSNLHIIFVDSLNCSRWINWTGSFCFAWSIHLITVRSSVDEWTTNYNYYTHTTFSSEGKKLNMLNITFRSHRFIKHQQTVIIESCWFRILHFFSLSFESSEKQSEKKNRINGHAYWEPWSINLCTERFWWFSVLNRIIWRSISKQYTANQTQNNGSRMVEALKQ